VPARISRRRDLEDDGHDTELSTTGLYSIHQTQVYVPPPVLRGRITKNAFGNLDVYVPSMVPPGGAHVRHPLTQQAARALKIDYADAVTGFKFQGRQGTAIIEGAVIPEEHRAAVQAVIEGLEQEALEEESRARSLTALRLWSRFMKGLRIAERVASYSEKGTAQDVGGKNISEVDFASGAVSASFGDDSDPTMPTAGQYTLDELARPAKLARKNRKKVIESDAEDYEDSATAPSGRRSGRKRGVVVIEDDEDEYMPDVEDGDGGGGGGFLPEDAQEVHETGGGFVPERPEGAEKVGEDYGGGGGFVREDRDAENMRGGFLSEDGEDEADMSGGGFVAEDADHDSTDDLFGEETRDTETHEASDLDHSPASNVEASNSKTNNNVAAVEYTPTRPTGADIPTMQASKISATAAPDHDTPLVSDNHPAADDENDSDRGSLLSHDPEDDDAEPDWLESD